MKSQTPNVKTFYKGQVVFKEGHESNVAYMIRKGQVNIYRVMNNKKVVLDKLGEGEIFGEMGIITGGNRTANAEAAEYCELMILTNQVLYNLLKQCPKTIQFLTKALIRRLKRTTSLIPEQVYQSSFMSICQILDLLYTNHLNMPQEERKNVSNYDMGMNYAQVSKKIKNIILVSQLEMDTIFKKLQNLKVLEISTLKSQKAAFPERYIKIADPKSFLEVAGNLYKELQRSDFSVSTELEYVDIYEFAEQVGTTPETLYQKIGAAEVPEALLFVHRPRASEWAEKMGSEFFQKVKKKKKKIEELEEVDDLVYVDNATLKQAFEKLGYYKLGVLYAIADEAAQKKIMANLARKIAQVVQQEAEGKEPDESEAEDVVDELFETVRELKGVSA